MATSSPACLVLESTAARKLRAGQLARLDGSLVEVIEVRGQWATVKSFYKCDGQHTTCDRLVSALKAVR